MVRFIAVSAATLGIALTGVHPVSVSNASPSNATQQCTFDLIPPKVLRISGVSFVTATVKPGSCGEVNPNFSEVCLSIEGRDSAGQCAWNSGPAPAVLYYTYVQGATYVVKGQGCVSLFAPPYTMCQDIAPSHVTL